MQFMSLSFYITLPSKCECQYNSAGNTRYVWNKHDYEVALKYSIQELGTLYMHAAIVVR